MIEIHIANCNNIEDGRLEIESGRLNIVFALNGTGKSTIARAIERAAAGTPLDDLRAFGLDADPRVDIPSELSKVLVFNEEFVSRVVFVESDVIQNAFDVFVRTPQFDSKRATLDSALKAIQLETITTPEFETLRKTGQSVLSKFTLTKSGDLKQTGLIKSLVSSTSIYTLPDEISRFKPMMDDRANVADWVGWKIQGSNYDSHKICPFCSERLSESYPVEKEVFQQSYSKSNVKNITEMLSFFAEVSDYMEQSKSAKLLECIRDPRDEKATKHWVEIFYKDLKYLMEKFDEIIAFNTFSLSSDDISQLPDRLKALQVLPDDLYVFNSLRTRDVLEAINGQIESLVAEADRLKNQIGELNGVVATAMRRAADDINEFLRVADINYRIEFSGSGDTETRAHLKYARGEEETGVAVSDIRRHLSWGERNAFALILFLHYAVSQDADLIVLDDPISSFDSNKKYAIADRLFRNSKSARTFYGSTVLMMTHDLQPIIDFVVLGKPHGQSATAMYLRNNHGILESHAIDKSDLESMPILLSRSATNADLNPVHRVVSLRKLIEHTVPDYEADPAYNLLSSLIHGAKSPDWHDGTAIVEPHRTAAEDFIRGFIQDFSYEVLLERVFNDAALKKLFRSESTPYFQVQVFRTLIGILNLRQQFPDSSILKYIDEQFHIENDYLFYLDLSRFNTVPDYVVDSCRGFLDSHLE